jgi:CBS domain-containing protein
MEEPMKVSEVMSRKVEIASPQDSIQRAAQMMARIDAGILPVAEGDRLIGMVTDRDIAVRGVGEGRSPTDTPVNEVMTREVK